MPNDYEEEWDSIAGLSSYYEQTLPMEESVEEPLRTQDFVPLLNFQSIENAATQFRSVMNKCVADRAAQPPKPSLSEATASLHAARLDAQYADIQSEYLRGVSEDDVFKWPSPIYDQNKSADNERKNQSSQASFDFGINERTSGRNSERVCVNNRKTKRELSEDEDDDEVEERATKFHFRPVIHFSSSTPPALCALSREALLSVISFLRVDEVLQLSASCRHLRTALSWWHMKCDVEKSNSAVDLMLSSWDGALTLLHNPDLGELNRSWN